MEIGASAFVSNASIQKFVMADSVEKIGESMFEYSKSITYAKMSRILKVIPAFTFLTCENIEEVVFPSQLERIGMFAFGGVHFAKQQNLVLPRTLTTLEYSAFKDYTGTTSKLKSITTWANNIGSSIFWKSTVQRINFMISDFDTLKMENLAFNGIAQDTKIYVKTDSIKNDVKLKSGLNDDSKFVVDPNLEQNYMKN